MIDYKIFSSSIQGPRDYQQDRFKTSYKHQDPTFVIADGMGGHKNGDLAAQDVINCLSEYQNPITALIEADKRCLLRGDKSGSTACIVQLKEQEIDKETISVISITTVGDSSVEIFGVKNDTIEKLYSSPLDETSWGSLSNCIGFLISENINLKRIPLTKKNTENYSKIYVTMYTDGCFEYLTATQIKETLMSASKSTLDPAKQLVELSSVKTEDNSTCVIIELILRGTIT